MAFFFCFVFLSVRAVRAVPCGLVGLLSDCLLWREDAL